MKINFGKALLNIQFDILKKALLSVQPPAKRLVTNIRSFIGLLLKLQDLYALNHK